MCFLLRNVLDPDLRLIAKIVSFVYKDLYVFEFFVLLNLVKFIIIYCECVYVNDNLNVFIKELVCNIKLVRYHRTSTAKLYLDRSVADH